jgi:hypothetical protein
MGWVRLLLAIPTGVNVAAVGESCTRLDSLVGTRNGSDAALVVISNYIKIHASFPPTSSRAFAALHHLLDH